MDFLIYWFARGVIAFFAALPLDTVARLGRGFGAIAYALDRRHREVALNNLRLAFGTEKPDAELKGIARENFRRLGENYCCAIKTAFMSDQEMAGRLEVRGVEHLRDAARAGENIVVGIGHFGNFEVYARTKFFLKDYTFATTYRALRQPSLTRLMQHLRSRSGCLFFERRTEAEALKLALKKGRLMVGLLADQHAGRSGVWIPFFGRDCSTTAAPAVLALRYDARLFTAVCYRKGLARWEIVVGPEIPLRDNEGAPLATAAIMSEVNLQLEAAVRRDPANWFWVHKRWKPADKRQSRETSADAAL